MPFDLIELLLICFNLQWCGIKKNDRSYFCVPPYWCVQNKYFLEYDKTITIYPIIVNNACIAYNQQEWSNSI